MSNRASGLIKNWTDRLREVKDFDTTRLISELYDIERDMGTAERHGSYEKQQAEKEVANYRGQLMQMEKRSEFKNVILCLTILSNAALIGVIVYMAVNK
jgi:hypothetical protein